MQTPLIVPYAMIESDTALGCTCHSCTERSGCIVEKEFVGVWSAPVANVVERGAVRKFAEAIGDQNPLYTDAAYAMTTRHGGLIAPPTFSRTFDYGVIKGLAIPEDGLIHGEQTFHYERPIRVGEELLCSTQLADVYARSGGNGTMTFYIYEQKGVTPSGELVFTARLNVIRMQEAHA